METARDRSIKEIINRAKQDKNDILQYIENLITYKLPEVKESSTNATQVFTHLAEKLNIDFHSNEELNNMIDLYISKLTVLKEELEAEPINEKTLLSKEKSTLERAQKIVELIEPVLEKAKDDFYTLSKNNLIKEYEQREKIKSEITNLKMKKMYFQGRLDATKNKRKKTEIESEIKKVDSEIQYHEFRLLNFEFQNDNNSINNQNTQMTKSNEIERTEGLEPDDDIMDK